MTEETTEFWWWANGDGKLKTVDQFELEQALSRGAIAPRTLVWKSGWAEWLRAAQVPELQTKLPRHLVSSPVQPRLDPEATHPPPVPREPGAQALDPIIPVASSPENDKPRTMVLVETEIAAQDLKPVSAEPPPPPSRRNGVNGMSGTNGSGKSAMPPIVPVDSNPTNDRPETGVLDDSEILFEEPPADKWKEVSRKSAPPPPSARAAQPPRPSPVIGVKTEPTAAPHPEPTEPTAAPAPADPRPSPAAAAAAALAGRAGSGAPAAPPPATGSLGALGKQTLIGMAPVAPLPNAPTLRGMSPDAAQPPAPAPVAAPPAPTPAAPPLAVTAPLAPPAASPAAPAPMAPVAPLMRTALMPQTQAAAPIPVATVEYPPIVPKADPENEGPTMAMDPIVPVSEPENEAPTRIHPAALRDNAPLPAFDLDPEGTAERAPQWQAPMQQQVAWAPPPKKSKLPLVIGIFLVLGLLGAAVVGVALFVLKPWEKEAPKPVATATTPAVETPSAPPASTAACTIEKKGERVAKSAVVSVPVAIATAPGGSLVAVGFADSATGATGVTIDAKSLETKEPFSRAGTKNVVGVVPLVHSGTLAFEVDRQGGELAEQRTVDAKQPFVIGQTPEGFSRVVQNGRPEAIWPDAAGEKTTEPRVATVEGQGHVVTFRRGTEIRVGWLKEDGTKKTGLSTVSAGGSRVGTPNIAAGEHGVLVSFAARESDGSPWSVRIAAGKPGALPSKAEAFSLPAGGPGGEAISPTAAALPGGRWLLQWTEGKAGSRKVRAQTLGADLKPLGDAFTLSPENVEAGQGAIGVAGDHAVATYLVKSATGYELWASSLACK